MLAEIALPIIVFTAIFGPGCVIEAKKLIGKIVLRKRIKKLIIKQAYRNIKSSEEICVICQDDIENSGKCYMLFCEHIYHKKCITKWLDEKPTCPCCNCLTLANGKKVTA